MPNLANREKGETIEIHRRASFLRSSPVRVSELGWVFFNSDKNFMVSSLNRNGPVNTVLTSLTGPLRLIFHAASNKLTSAKHHPLQPILF